LLQKPREEFEPMSMDLLAETFEKDPDPTF